MGAGCGEGKKREKRSSSRMRHHKRSADEGEEVAGEKEEAAGSWTEGVSESDLVDGD
jgi:hypothetical protein